MSYYPVDRRVDTPVQPSKHGLEAGARAIRHAGDAQQTNPLSPAVAAPNRSTTRTLLMVGGALLVVWWITRS